MDCIFCKIINEELNSYKVYEDNDLLVFLDINPLSVGHCLIIPKKHVLDLMEISDEILSKIMIKSRDIAKLLVDKLGADGFTLTQNNGICQDVMHYHLHLIPKYKKKVKLSLEEVFDLLVK